MRFATFTLAASLAGYAMAQAKCDTICKPIKELMAGCSAAKMPVSKMAENCVCMNKSFDVPKLGGLCMACIMGNGKESDVMMQVGMACPFQAIEYTPAADAMAQGVMVSIPKDAMPSGTMPDMPGMSAMPGMPNMPGTMNEGSRSSMSGLAVGAVALLMAFGLA